MKRRLVLAAAITAGSLAAVAPAASAAPIQRSSIVCANSWFCANWWSFPGGLTWVLRNAS